LYGGSYRYAGQLEGGEKHGKGVQEVFATGECYEGNWVRNSRHGWGFATTPDGEHYAGLWELGYREGRGTQIYADGSRYQGNWHQNLRSGNGTLYSAGGDCIYEGEWLGKEHGRGQYTFPPKSPFHGFRYHGTVQDGSLHGKGVMTDLRSGETFDIEWWNDKPVTQKFKDMENQV
jgi:hypothetical protein